MERTAKDMTFGEIIDSYKLTEKEIGVFQGKCPKLLLKRVEGNAYADTLLKDFNPIYDTENCWVNDLICDLYIKFLSLKEDEELRREYNIFYDSF